MGLESASYITDLNALWPLATDERRQGDDHLRNVKACLQAQFPSLGNSVAVNPTAAELNYLVGVTSLVQTQLTAAMQLEAGMQFLCRAAALPANGFWSLNTDDNDVVPSIVNSFSDTTGGSWTISGLTGGTSGSTNLGSHTHSGPSVTVSHSGTSYTGSAGVISAGSGNDGELFSHTASVGSIGSTNLGSHTHSGASVSSTGAWRPAYRNVVTLQYDG
tara:strand:- start:157 stop:810 length:654 start_codon:yes stop_codon:yes gene_type:complete